MPSWYKHCRGRSIGRVIHFLYWYCGFNTAEYAKVGQDTVTMYGEVIATYFFLSDTDIPLFQFKGKEAVMWEANQRNHIFDAIHDGDPATKEPCQECRGLKLKLDIFGIKRPPFIGPPDFRPLLANLGWKSSPDDDWTPPTKERGLTMTYDRAVEELNSRGLLDAEKCRATLNTMSEKWLAGDIPLAETTGICELVVAVNFWSKVGVEGDNGNGDPVGSGG